MSTIELVVGPHKYYLNNNSEKFNRAKKEAGENASPAEILAHYDHLGGLIQNEKGENLENGKYWDAFTGAMGEYEKLIKLQTENDNLIEESLTNVYELSNKNVEQRRIYLGTLMTISAAVTAGLFFLFSNDYHFSADPLNQEFAFILAKMDAGFNTLFLIFSSLWLAGMLSQEGMDLDRRKIFLESTRRELSEKLGKEIRNEQGFWTFVKKKIEDEKMSTFKKLFDHETFFWIVYGLFFLTLVPLVFIFLSQR